ncbi:MAG: helix-turn-helix domain-containing protein [Cyanobacteriota bacterium]
MTVGSRLKEFRTSLGLTQEEFALYFNVPGHKIGDIEQDRHKLPLTFLEILEEELGVSIRWILIGKGDMNLETFNEKGGSLISDIQKTLQSAFEIPMSSAIIIEENAEKLIQSEQKVMIIPKDLIITDNLDDPNLFAYQVESNAMSPVYNKNDIVIVDEKQKGIIINETYLIQYYGKYLLVRASFSNGDICFITDKFSSVYNKNESNIVGKIIAYLRTV